MKVILATSLILITASVLGTFIKFQWQFYEQWLWRIWVSDNFQKRDLRFESQQRQIYLFICRLLRIRKLRKRKARKVSYALEL